MMCASCLHRLKVEHGAMLSNARRKAGLTQVQLAAMLRIKRSQIAMIETGRSNVTVSLLAEFAAAFGCPLKELVP